MSNVNRRPLKSRGSTWALSILKILLKTPVTPNQISIASIGFALLAAVSFYFLSPSNIYSTLFLAIIGIQGRLLCNLMDGMVALEGQRTSKLGELYNEFPDRISDIIIFLSVGYGYASNFNDAFLSFEILGWSAALLAVLTAYVRIYGASLGAGQNFAGPMAKPQRMATLTISCIVEILGRFFLGFWIPVMQLALVVIILGSIITLYRRVAIIVRFLHTKNT